MHNVESKFENGEVVYPLEGTITRMTHMLFQGMFFIITPGLICGAFAERMKFSAMMLFSLLWGTIVYCPLCHWVWDAGILAYGPREPFWAARWTLPVEPWSTSVGRIGFGLCAGTGKRKGYGHVAMPPHNLTYTVIGAALLWVGWFGFNAGSALNASGLASTHLPPRILRPPPVASPGRPPNGSARASPPCWVPPREPWPDWFASRRPRALSARWQRWPWGPWPGSFAFGPLPK